MSDPNRPKNRLARESSPYLRLHADNPVDWYPWGDEAFARAREEDKPIFLSVGYSTCYWCHVMERESFSDEHIAAQLNAAFVCVKLDREERPDLDEIYMTATQLLTRQGGWPNSLFLDHELRPFFAGTYFPPVDRHGRPGLPRLVAGIVEAWRARRDDVLAQAAAVAAGVAHELTAGTASPRRPAAELGNAAQALLARAFDSEWGGFGGAPKFPSPANLFLLLERARGGDGEAREMLLVTLDRMARGGLHDQLAGGFHRYSTDAYWLVPHFEKMLYDNALLARLYAEAAHDLAALAPREDGASSEEFERVARATCDFVLAELLDEQGGFWSALDAETDGQEGGHHVWSAAELAELLEPDALSLLGAVYGFDGAPNFEGEHYVLHLPLPWAEQARALGLSEVELRRRVEIGRRALLAARQRRTRPLTDDKILCDWNGLMIAALARVGQLLGEPRYLAASRRAARFVLARLRDEAGELQHVWRDGRAHVAAQCDDYAFLIDGLLALHAADGDDEWLRAARRAQDEQDARLWDDAAGAYFASRDQGDLLVRARTAHDGALPSGNGVSACNLLALFARTGEERLRARAERLLRAFGTQLEERPLAHVTLLLALERFTALADAPTGQDSVRDAQAVLHVEASYDADAPGPWKPLRVDLRVDPGWHVNAHDVALPFLVPTRLEGAGLRALRYPAGVALSAAFADEPTSVYTGLVTITGEVEIGPRGAPQLTLTCQPCDERACLLAVSLPVTPRPAAL